VENLNKTSPNKTLVQITRSVAGNKAITTMGQSDKPNKAQQATEHKQRKITADNIEQQP
jgi:hypothetical protein